MTDREELEARLSRLWGRTVLVTDLVPLAGGASRETLRFSAEGRELVLRRDVTQSDATAMTNEATAMAAAAAAGVPVPALIDSGTSLGGHPYVVMAYVAGETLPRRLLRDARFDAVRPRLAGELGAVAARIHTMRAAGLPRPDPIGLLQEISDDYDVPRPTVELGLAWLRAHRPPAGPDTVVHGDLRNGNVLMDAEGIRAVLDWELVHRGDPVEDLGWLCVKAWRFGSTLPVGGFGTRTQLLDGYEKVAGWRPSDEQLRWWEVYGTLRWVLICRMQAAGYLTGKRDSLEHAVIGRRVCEAEFDLLIALGLARPSAVDDPLGETSTGLPPHDAPGADDLLAAVTRTLASRESYLDRVAANALRIVRRELALGPSLAARHQQRLAALGVADDAAIAAAIRTGSTTPALVAAVLDTVRDKLLVANPRYLGQPDGA